MRLLLALLVTGCGESLGTVAADGASLTVSGGIAGVRRGIEVGPNGEVFLTNRKGELEQADAPKPAEKKTLDALLDAVEASHLRDGDALRLPGVEFVRPRMAHRLESTQIGALLEGFGLLDHS
ncbi:hypothetical protein [Streptomyces mesophilus]|uniref:hypothetical protein n=1 Tax=Streptomyces mesophilus TaxID=1775132 RepID=UPI003328942C